MNLSITIDTEQQRKCRKDEYDFLTVADHNHFLKGERSNRLAGIRRNVNFE